MIYLELFLAMMCAALGWHVGVAIIFNALAQANGYLHHRRAKRAQTMLTAAADDPDNKNVVHMAPKGPGDNAYL